MKNRHESEFGQSGTVMPQEEAGADEQKQIFIIGDEKSWCGSNNGPG